MQLGTQISTKFSQIFIHKRNVQSFWSDHQNECDWQQSYVDDVTMASFLHM